MGKIISLKTDKIRPSQDFLKEKTVIRILENYFKGRMNALPPIPLVRYVPEKDEYIAIDGHNLIALYDLIGEEMKVYVAESNDDYLTKDNFPESSEDSLQDRNSDLKDKFDLVIDDAEKVMKKGIVDFADLRGGYDYLESVDAARKFYNESFLLKEFKIK